MPADGWHRVGRNQLVPLVTLHADHTMNPLEFQLILVALAAVFAVLGVTLIWSARRDERCEREVQTQLWSI